MIIDIKKLEQDKEGFENLLAEQHQRLEDAQAIILRVEGILGYIAGLIEQTNIPEPPPEKSKEV